jgi:hypothetical protein
MAGRAVLGWRNIAAHVSTRTGFSVGIDSLKRAARRADNPLPIRRWGASRPRVVADSAKLDAWVDTQWTTGRQST